MTQTAHLPVPISHTNQDFPITIEREKGGVLVVVYGSQRKRCDSYESAAKELGFVMMHSLTLGGHVPEHMVRQSLKG